MCASQGGIGSPTQQSHKFRGFPHHPKPIFADKASAVPVKLWQVLLDMYFFRYFQLPADPRQHRGESLVRNRVYGKKKLKKK